MLLHSHAWHSREAKRPALSVALISKKASMRVNEWAMGWSTALPTDRMQKSSWPGHDPRDRGLETRGGVKPSCFEWEKSGCNVCNAIWSLVERMVWAILCSSQGVFCKGKSSLATATYSSAPVQYLQPIAATDIYCSKGRWRRGLGSARSTTHCMRERKSLLIMSVGHQRVPWAYATSYTSWVSS